ncbi:hypothetical protein [uncultured Nostoc sp.]|uniref:hypothetical protein n=1 Tax=uncultured Nostoc sp. TaxID=340711 RepID=UPI0035CB5A3C
MLQTTSKAGKDSFSISFDNQDDNLLSELSYDEASEIMGGFTVTNNSGSTRGFYNFGQNVVPQQQVLQPGQSGNYNGEYILYNSSITQFKPALSQQLGATDTVSFTLQGDTVVAAKPLSTIGLFSLQVPLSDL